MANSNNESEELELVKVWPVQFVQGFNPMGVPINGMNFFALGNDKKIYQYDFAEHNWILKGLE